MEVVDALEPITPAQHAAARRVRAQTVQWSPGETRYSVLVSRPGTTAEVVVWFRPIVGLTTDDGRLAPHVVRWQCLHPITEDVEAWR